MERPSHRKSRRRNLEASVRKDVDSTECVVYAELPSGLVTGGGEVDVSLEADHHSGSG